MKKYVILDLYIFNQREEILVNSSSENSSFNSNSKRPIILYSEMHTHPIEQIKKYLKDKNLILSRLKFLPTILLNQFDTEEDEDYLVLAFRIDVKIPDMWIWVQDDMNMSAYWESFDIFAKSPDLLPELKDKLFTKSLEGASVYYKGMYKESDGSNDVITKEIIEI